MANGNDRKVVKKSEALWMMSFSDMSLVLMCFFALLLSTMSPDRAKFEHIQEGFRDQGDRRQSLRDVATQLQRAITERQLESQAQVQITAQGVQLELKSGILFASAEAQLTEASLPLLGDIFATLRDLPPTYRIRIEGHTDDTPLQGHGRYPSNWELSAARAASVLALLRGIGVDEQRMEVMGRAHTEPRLDPAELTGDALRQARATNRRVAIRVY